MEKVKTQLLLAASVILMVTSMVTCRQKQFNGAEITHAVDTALVSRLESNNQFLQQQYKKRLAVLEATNDSLLQSIKVKKQQLLSYRFKTAVLEQQLKEQLVTADSTGVLPDSLTLIAASYIEAQQVKDSVCTATINELENLVVSKDSVCTMQSSMIVSLNDAFNLKELKVQVINEHLQLTTGELNKKKKQNKLLRGGICILSGIATSLLIMQAVK